MMVHNPRKLLEENLDDLFVIITTSGFQEVDEQLRGYGLLPGKHYCVSTSLKDFQTISRINNHEQKIYLTCSDHHLPDESEKGGGLYSFDLQARKMEKIINGLCHGITKGKDCFYLVDDTVGVRILENDFKERGCFELPPKAAPHGIAYCPQRDIIFINFSGRDSIAFFDAETCTQIDEVFLSDKWRRMGVAQHHVNDLCVCENSLLVSMFSFSGNWKNEVFDGGILEYDIDSRQKTGTLISGLWMPHTPTIINDVLHFCDSMRGRVGRGTSRLLTEFHGFVRGIAYDGEFFYIGQSMHRHIDRRQGTATNIALDTGVFMVDDASKATKFFAMPQLTDINTVFIASCSSGNPE